MNVQLDTELMKTVVAEALLKTLSTDARDKLVSGAIAFLLTEDKTGGIYGSKKAPIQQAFEDAITTQARVLIRAEMDSNVELNAKIKQLFADAVEKMVMGDGRDKLVDKLAYALQRGLTEP